VKRNSVGAAGAALLLLGGLLAGCAPASAPQRTVNFAAAATATTPVSIEGILVKDSLVRNTGKPTEFTLREESSATPMKVTAPVEVSVPANITSASYVQVTGTYHAGNRQFVATQVETRVPTREEQH